MKTLNLIQGSPEWEAHRLVSCNASELAVVLGLKSGRDDLIRIKATGIAKEYSDWVQRNLFDRGHEYEAIARQWAEEIATEELFPVTGMIEPDGLRVSASFDGLSMDDSVAFEHKSLNAELCEWLDKGEIPPVYWPQMEQGLMVSGAEKCLFMASSGDKETMRLAWYYSRPELRAKIIPAWKQFMMDVSNYQHVDTKPEATGRAPETLPALHVEVTGMVTSSNLLAFKETALAVFRGINTDLQTDADFADAEKTVKWCKDVEDRLEQTKQHALSQTASIDELFRTMDGIKEEARTVRLKLDKLVKAEKENRKVEIVMAARQAIELHVAELNKRIGGAWLPATSGAPFAEAIKGLKSLDSMRDKIGAALANAKVEASAIADRIEANRKYLDSRVSPYQLAPDFAQICTKIHEDFANLIQTRHIQHKAAEDQRIEAERARIRAEEQAKAEREAQAKALEESDRIRAEERKKMQDEQNARNAEMQRQQAEQDARDAETARQRALEQEHLEKERAELKEASDKLVAAVMAQDEATKVDMGIPISDSNQQVDTSATIKLGEICERLGFAITAQFLASIGFEPVGHERAAKLYRECDFRAICIALVKHITGLYAVKESA